MESRKPKVTFDLLKSTVAKYHSDKIKSDPNSWNSLKDIPPNEVFTLIGLMKKS